MEHEGVVHDVDGIQPSQQCMGDNSVIIRENTICQNPPLSEAGANKQVVIIKMDNAPESELSLQTSEVVLPMSGGPHNGLTLGQCKGESIEAAIRQAIEQIEHVSTSELSIFDDNDWFLRT